MDSGYHFIARNHCGMSLSVGKCFWISGSRAAALVSNSRRSRHVQRTSLLTNETKPYNRSETSSGSD